MSLLISIFLDRWWGNKQIAFSAYLSADKHLGKNQHIKFDQVLLNDGNGYEASTGIFRYTTNKYIIDRRPV